MTTPEATEERDLGRAVEAVAGGDTRGLPVAAKALQSSMRAAGARSVSSGKWLADTVLDLAAHLPTRDLATLQAHHHGLEGRALADAVIKAASQTTAAIGAAAGALASVEEFAPPAWVAIPLELLVEIVAVAAVEMKLVAELHEVYLQPIRGSAAERALAVCRAWGERRGVTALALAEPGGLATMVGGTARREVTKLVRRRLARRTARSLWSLAPLMVGAVAGAGLNRRATRSLGEAIRDDLEP